MDTVTSSNSKSLNSSDLSSENGLLGILDLITDESEPVMEVYDRSSKINNLIFGPHLVNLSSISNHLINQTVPKSTPSNDQNTPDRETPMAITASQILLSEDYTRVTCYGPNPRITHIFFDFSLEYYCHPNRLIVAYGKKREEMVISLFHQVATCSCAPSVEFPNLCEACSKKLEVGEDVYIYRFALKFHLLIVSKFA